MYMYIYNFLPCSTFINKVTLHVTLIFLNIFHFYCAYHIHRKKKRCFKLKKKMFQF